MNFKYHKRYNETPKMYNVLYERSFIFALSVLFHTIFRLYNISVLFTQSVFLHLKVNFSRQKVKLLLLTS